MQPHREGSESGTSRSECVQIGPVNVVGQIALLIVIAELESNARDAPVPTVNVRERYAIHGLCAGALKVFPTTGKDLGPGGSGRPRVRIFQVKTERRYMTPTATTESDMKTTG